MHANEVLVRLYANCLHISILPNPARSEMLRGYQLMKDRALVSGEKTRNILTQGLVGLNKSSIVALPTLSSVKRTIRRHKSLVEENVINHDSAAELRIPDKYQIYIKGRKFSNI